MFRILNPVVVLAVCQLAMADGQVSFISGTDKIEIKVDSKPMATFYYGKEWPKPFLHGLRAASGATVTRGFPVEKIGGAGLADVDIPYLVDVDQNVFARAAKTVEEKKGKRPQLAAA